MSQYQFDRDANNIAGVQVYNKGAGSVGSAAVKSGTGNSTLPNTLQQMGDIDDVEVFLAASTFHGVGYYTPKRLAQMTKRDKVHAALLGAAPTSQR